MTARNTQTPVDIVDGFSNLEYIYRIGALEEHKRQAESSYATKADIERLEGLINTNHKELKGVLTEKVLESENKTLKEFIKLWILIAGVVFSAGTTLFSSIANRIFSPG